MLKIGGYFNFSVSGPRACYDEGKRISETLTYAYAQQENMQVRVARIFNTYGPRMHMNDGRVVSNFILQALKSDVITVCYKVDNFIQLRSFFYRYMELVTRQDHFNMLLI